MKTLKQQQYVSTDCLDQLKRYLNVNTYSTDESTQKKDDQTSDRLAHNPETLELSGTRERDERESKRNK